jgi:hypothetical protein
MRKYSLLGMGFVGLIAVALLGLATNAAYAAPVAQVTATPETTPTVEPTADPAATPDLTATTDPAATAEATTTAEAGTPTPAAPGTLPQTGDGGPAPLWPIFVIAALVALAIGAGAAIANRPESRPRP